RDSVPTARCMVSTTATTGSARNTPISNSIAPALASAPQPAAWIVPPTATGITAKLLTSAPISTRWPLKARNSTRPTRPKKSAITGTAKLPSTPSSVAKPKPICTPTKSPASDIALSAICMAKPTASATLSGTGMVAPLNTGAAANRARVRTNGHQNSPLQRSMSASLQLGIPRLFQRRDHRGGGFARETRHLRAEPRARDRDHQHHREEARHEMQGQVVHPRPRLEQRHGQPDDEAGAEKRADDDQRQDQNMARRQHDLGRRHRMKPSASEPITSVQPFTKTNSMSVIGSDTVVGDSSIMPSDIITAATTMSMTMNGRKIRKPIWNPVLSSDVTKAGTRRRNGTSLGVA